ncbi:MAG: pantetheine-phosphate adenylyltransferase [Caldilineaceae bacterium]|nr:pantetheine-phosphate adenylyltransferase [Caldilineaceae bacterium]HRJ41505.1 pantetheine-phosphate adenylyltransferase [Caldilineaceae bacterium]
MIRALYPGTFDPMHNGHIDIAQRAAAIFDEVIIGVYDAPPKKLLFNTDERVELVSTALAHLTNCSIVAFTGLTVECARAVGARVIVRGLRNVADFEFESQIGLANRQMAPDVELCCLLSSTEYIYLSSTIVKEVAGLDGEISQWVHPSIAQAMRRRLAENGTVSSADTLSGKKNVTKTRGKLTHHG